MWNSETNLRLLPRYSELSTKELELQIDEIFHSRRISASNLLIMLKTTITPV